MSKVLFIQPYDLPKISTGKMRKIAYLSRTGFEVGYQIPQQYDFSLLDLNIEVHQGKTIPSSIREKILDENPDIVFVTFPSFAQGFQVKAAIQAVRNISTTCKVVLGGAAISLVKNAPLKWWPKYRISGCYNGFGIEIPAIIRYFLSDEGNKPPHGLYTRGSQFQGNAKPVLIDGYSADNFFSVNGRFNFSTYLASFLESGIRPIGLLEMMRGCGYQCSFCAINKMRLGCHFRSVRTVANEAAFLADHGIKHMHLIDPTFGLDKEKAYSLLDLLSFVSRHYGATFEIVTRANMISKEFARAMKEAGVIRCDIGMETMTDKNLKSVKKGTNPEVIKQAVEHLTNQNIQVKLFHITFPGKISSDTLMFMFSLEEKGIDFLVQSSYLRTLPTTKSAPMFFEQDQFVFVPEKDDIQQLMERILVNLCFKSMDTGYYDDSLMKEVKKIIESGSSLELLFDIEKESENRFKLKLRPSLNSHLYLYIHNKTRPFSLGMCRV